MNIKKINIIIFIAFFLILLLSLVTVIFAVFSDSVPYVPEDISEYTRFSQDQIISSLAFSILFIIAMIIIVMSFFIRRLIENSSRFALINLAMFVLLTAIWIFMGSGAAKPYFNNYFVMYLINYFSFYLLPIPFLFFVSDMCTDGKPIFAGLSAFMILLFSIDYIYIVTHNFAFPQTLPIIHILIGLTIIFTLYSFCVELFKYKNKDVIEVFIATIILAAISTIVLIFYYTRPIFSYTFYMMIAMVLFISLLFICTAKRILRTLSKARSFENTASSIPSGIFCAKNDEHLSIIYANDFFYKIYGYKSETAARAAEVRFVDQHMTREARKSLSDFQKQGIKNGTTTLEFETRETDKRGNEIWLLNRVRYLAKTNEMVGAIIDITDRKRMENELHLKEEEYKIVVHHIKRLINRYDVKGKTLFLTEKATDQYKLPLKLKNMPKGNIVFSKVAPESREAYAEFYNKINRGESSGKVTVQFKSLNLTRYWWTLSFDSIFDEHGQPERAIIIGEDVTDIREKELAYQKWRQEVDSIPKEKLALFECNLTLDTLDKVEGNLLALQMDMPYEGFDARSIMRSENIHPEDRATYLRIANRKHLMSEYDAGHFFHELEYRTLTADNQYIWIHVSIQLVKYPNTNNIKAYMMVLDVDEKKSREVALIERSELDVLTGVLNRRTFIEQSSELLRLTAVGTTHAFLMLDIDDFKRVNDTFGHMEGDALLIAIAGGVKSILRDGDLIGRMGGDEFIICLKNVPNADVIKKRANDICKMTHKQLESNVEVSVSIGVAMYPRDGNNFNQLYAKVDIALYAAKGCGRNSYMFYKEGLSNNPEKEANDKTRENSENKT
ncbi:MAG: diguanylate cyclase [Clostridia bacterium]